MLDCSTIISYCKVCYILFFCIEVHFFITEFNICVIYHPRIKQGFAAGFKFWLWANLFDFKLEFCAPSPYHGVVFHSRNYEFFATFCPNLLHLSGDVHNVHDLVCLSS